ncbi:shikimate dehydrogenase [Alkalithermobacter thermoalcaliphilus JW-YL-7 = DSM 7308]|uniref:Shikimate dehydrogenase (NADP(+)) n=1 Tax=Alkalithermobacter thermoalcaliphilus JW-YL-7 = DSM 7308 TaxID=1121328 RepID=A0A150FSS4_CLOPD|nr:Shikimate dehydrogenase [[Clostridium] paradoxum JW-YL-7 = DSM 7308]SHL00885.1 shikimate dehydrogenase [[Clostridium] paradoxum JW-YL-7 = DSM 7308]
MIDANTKLICLMGHPVKHSFSPYIHNYLFDKYNLNYKYVCFDIEQTDIKQAINSIKYLKMKGANITIPYKEKVLEYLDEISFEAKVIGAVNTIKNENGKLIGYNTDGVGFVKSILDKNYNIKGKKFLILGAGGSAKSIAVELAKYSPEFIHIKNRNIENAAQVCNTLNENFNILTKYSSLPVNKEDIETIDILINTTPLGMSPNDNTCIIDTNLKIQKRILVCDIVYNPQETKLLKWAKRNNMDTISGIYMLINQAIKSFNIWTDINVEKTDEKEIQKRVGV